MQNEKIWCSNSEIPEPNDTKFEVGDYVVDITPLAKIHYSCPSGGIPWYKWNITFVWFLDQTFYLSRRKPLNRFLYFLICRYGIVGFNVPLDTL